MRPAVSIVVATYDTDPADLERLITSVDAQTLPQSALETVFVDDGSPGHRTWDALQAIAATRPNVIVERIPHSGWPSRPRNVGTDLARGEWVIYADHDDLLLPGGLEAAAAFAAEHDLDVLNLKEIESAQPGHALDAFLTDVHGSRADLGVRTLLPMTPHKLYRRDWLHAAGVRFPEGDGGRVMWEDILFNIDAFAAARRIGALADVCVYHHLVHDSNASHAYRPDTVEYWQTVTSVMEHVDARLAGEEFDDDRRAVLSLHYRDRVVRRLAMLSEQGDEAALAMAAPYARSLTERYLEPDSARSFPLREQRTGELARAERFDELRKLQHALAPVAGTSSATAVRFDGDALRLDLASTWTAAPSVVEPGLLGARDAAEAEVITEQVDAARALVVLRERTSHETTTVPTTTRVGAVDTADPLRTLGLTAHADVPLRRPRGLYDVFVRNSALGFTNTRPVRTDTPALVALVDGVGVVAYTTKSGRLALDVGPTIRSVVNSAGRDVDAATVRRSGSGFEVRVPLSGVHVVGGSRVPATVTLVPTGGGDSVESAATLVGEDGGAWLEFTAPDRAGRFGVHVDVHGRASDSGLVLTVPPRWRGRARVTTR